MQSIIHAPTRRIAKVCSISDGPWVLGKTKGYSQSPESLFFTNWRATRAYRSVVYIRITALRHFEFEMSLSQLFRRIPLAGSVTAAMCRRSKVFGDAQFRPRISVPTRLIFPESLSLKLVSVILLYGVFPRAGNPKTSSAGR